MLTFEKEGHRYILNGQEVPSVTQIVAAVTGDGNDDIPLSFIEAARERGEKIHKDVELEKYETEEGKWIKTHLPGSVAHEVMGATSVDGTAFAGTADIIQTVEGAIEILDIKSQAQEDRLRWTIQLNLYREIFGAERLFVLHVPKSGD